MSIVQPKSSPRVLPDGLILRRVGRRGVFFAVAFLAFAFGPRANAIELVLDYSFDDNNEGWFRGSPEGLARRAAVDTAASFLSAIITNNDWNAISVFNKDLSFSDIAASSINDLHGNSVAGVPESDGRGFSYEIDLTNISSVNANEYVIYVGAFPFDSAASAHAKGGFDGSDRRNAAGNAATEFNTWGGKIYFDSGDSWYAGQNPGVNPTSNYGVQDPNKMPSSDITTDNWDWHTGSLVWKGFELDTIDPTAVNKSDLYASALHEMMHALGATSGNMSTYVGVSDGSLIGPHVVAEYGGPVPKSSTTGHFANDVQSEVWNSDGIISEVTLDPNAISATRKYLTKLDVALLRDLGYDVVASLSRADFNFDGMVDHEDLALWQAGYGINALGDANGDQVTRGDDLLTWQREFGFGQETLPASSQVPEPSTGVLFTGILLARLLWNRS